jgi:hypothetical protein
MNETTRLTAADRRTIAHARVLTELTSPAAVRALAGDEDNAMAYAVAFGRAQHHLDDLLAIIGRLGGHG